MNTILLGKDFRGNLPREIETLHKNPKKITSASGKGKREIRNKNTEYF